MISSKIRIMKNEVKNFKYIDIFAGCGGISSGLCNAGWKGVFAIEKDPMAFETLKFNLMDHFDWPNWLPKKEFEINRLINEYKKELTSLRGKVDLVVGGPPCQGFSMAGKRKSNDKRNKMVDAYVKFIKIVQPKFLFFENVYGFTTATKKKTKLTEKAYSEYVVTKLKSLGYDVAFEIIDFSEFGVPQRRKRFILVGVKNATAKSFFDDIRNHRDGFLKEKGISKFTSSEDAISDLEKDNGTITSIDSPRFEMGKYSKPRSKYQKLLRVNIKDQNSIPDSHRFSNHNKNIIDKFSYILKHAERNKSIDDRIKIMFNTKKRTVTPLDKSRPSPTLTTLPDDYIHYREPRILTVREYARLQSFDDSFQFKGKYTTGGKNRTKEVPRYTQIGNAIPPLFGEQVGHTFKRINQWPTSKQTYSSKAS